MRTAYFLAVFFLLSACTKKEKLDAGLNKSAARITVKGHAIHKYLKAPVAGMKLNIIAVVADDLFSGHEEPVGSCETDANGDYIFSFDNSSNYSYTEIRSAGKNGSHRQSGLVVQACRWLISR